MADDRTSLALHEQAMLGMHKEYLEALRHREQDILRFLIILGPALGWFIWLLGKPSPSHSAMFVAGTYGVLLVLVTGAFYALALGYNYRYLTLQVAKIEAKLNLNRNDVVLKSWPRNASAFKAKSRWGVIPWCTPPGIIKVFWLSFIVCILGVTLVAWQVLPGKSQHDEHREVHSTNALAKSQPAGEGRPATHRCGASHTDECKDHPPTAVLPTPFKTAIPWVGGACLLFTLMGPISDGRKMLKACDAEPPSW